MSRPRVIACWGIKYEPDWLIEELKENLSWVDGHAIVDCRSRTDEFWIHEGEYRVLQREAYLAQEADWVLITSPDERWERNAESVIREVTQTKHKALYNFPLYEMFTPTEYRIDGIWGQKRRTRLFPVYPDQKFTNRRIQSSPAPLRSGYAKRKLDVRLYHLKTIEPESRKNRALAYEATDLDGKYQRLIADKLEKRVPGEKFHGRGYHYLYDMEGAVLEQLPEGREFHPPYTQPYIFAPEGLNGSIRPEQAENGQV